MVRKTRRSLLRDAGLACGLLAGGGLVVDSATADTSTGRSDRFVDAGDDWPTLHGTPARTGFTTTAGPVEDPFADRLPASTPAVTTVPSVVDDVAYYTSGDETAVAYDLNRETTLWETDVLVGANPGVVVDDGTVYVLGESRTLHNCVPVSLSLVAIDAADGTVRWEYEIDGDSASRPAVVDGTTYTVVDGSLLAVDDGGTERWKTTLPPEITSLPAVADELVVTCGYGGVVALDASDGSEVWHNETAPGDHPTIADETVYVVDGIDLKALSLADGTRRWQADRPSGDYGHFSSSAAVGDGRVYVATDEGYVHAFSTTDGSHEWRSREVGEGPICVGDETVYVGVMRHFDNTSSVFAIDATDGSLRWEHPVWDVWGDGYPVLADGTLFLYGDVLSTLASDHPGVQWRETIASADESVQRLGTAPLATADTFVTAGTETGYRPENAVVAVDRSTREFLWSYDTGDPVTRLFDAGSGRILTGTRERIVVLDEASGTVERQISTDDNARVTTSAVLDDLVFATIEPQSVERPYLAAFDVATGEEQWRFSGIPSESEGPLWETGSLFAADGQVFASVVETSDDDSVVALDAATGEVNWYVSGSYNLKGVTEGLVFTRSDSELFARSATDGSVQWQTDETYERDDTVDVTTGDGRVYVPDDREYWRGVTALSLDDGSVEWSTEFSDSEAVHTADPVYADGTVYVSYGRQVIGLEAADGAIRDRYGTRATVGGVVSETDAVYLTDESGYLTAIDPFA